MAQLFGRDVFFGLEAFDFATDADVKPTSIEQRDRVDARAPAEQVGPRFGNAVADRRDGAQASHHDTPRSPQGQNRYLPVDSSRGPSNATTASLRLTAFTSVLMRRIKRDSTSPGPISTN